MLHTWRVLQQEFFPLLQPSLTINEKIPELTPLLLPSSFDSDQRLAPLLKDAAEIEFKLRLGQAYDILQDVRDSIHEYYYFTTERGLNSNSQSLATRNMKPLRELILGQDALVNRYMYTFKALNQLGLATDCELKPLRRDQLWGKNVFLPHHMGDSTKDFPWFWYVGRSSKYTQDAWLVERMCSLTNMIYELTSIS
jgi:hypothetical protein